MIKNKLDVCLNNKINIIKINSELNNKLKKILNTKNNTYQIIDEKFISQYKLGKYKDNYNFYYNRNISNKIEKYLENKSIIGIPYRNIINKILTKTNKLYIVGGMIRDIIIGSEINDIDLSFNLDVNNIYKICYENKLLCYLNEGGKYVKFSEDVEGFYDTYRVFKKNKINYDFTVNNLIYDIKNKVIIEQTSDSLYDIANKLIRIPVTPDKYLEWVILKYENPLRFFKLILKGFEPINYEIQNFIIKYIENNFKKVYLKLTSKKIPIIKDFLIRFITNGKIIDKDKYCYGTKMNNLIPYLKILSKYLDIKIVKKIFNLIDTKVFCYRKRGKFNYPCYKIPSLNKYYTNFIKNKLENMDNSYHNIFKELLTITDNIYIYGGFVRDVLLNKNPTDIDIMFDSNLKNVKKLCLKNNWPCSKIVDKFSFIIFGKNKGITLEGHYKLTMFKHDILNYDFSINQMVYDVKNKLVYDLTGYGLEDTINKKIRIPIQKNKYNLWTQKNRHSSLIYFKLKLKGFKPINNKTEQFIINYIQNNFNNVYMKKNNKGIENIKNYLINILTHGEIYPDGTYKLGHNKKRLIPYLKIMSKSINKKYMKQIKKLLEN